MRPRNNNLNIGDVALNLRKFTFFSNLSIANVISTNMSMIITFRGSAAAYKAHNSSISAGVRSDTSGKMNHPMTTAMAPVAAKLYLGS